MRAPNGSTADVQGRRDNVGDSEPFKSVHGPDDIDDGIERADFVEVHSLDRRPVDRRFGLGETFEQRDCALLARVRQRRPFDRRDNVFR